MVNRKGSEVDITRNIKIIEGLKSQILTEIAALFRSLVSGFKEDAREEIGDAIANIIIIAFLLSKRLGITYNAIGLKVQNKIRNGIINQQEEEKYYGDLTELAKYMNNDAKKK
ncbi:MAG: MazG-like family protein [Deltaproteobacteria bacterium]